jgi:uncharacterized membrane protein
MKQKVKSLTHRLLGYLLKGFLVMLPILGTLAIIVSLGGLFESILGKPLQWVLGLAHLGGWYKPGMGTALSLLIILFVGIFVNTWIVQALLKRAGEAFDRIPMVKSIYGSIRDLMGFFASKEGKKTAQVVIVTLGDPTNPVSPRALGLLTREDFSDLPSGFTDGRDVVAVYIPLSYAMGGFTTLVPRSAVRYIDMNMEEAMRFAITAGMAVKPAPEQTPVSADVEKAPGNDKPWGP